MHVSAEAIIVDNTEQELSEIHQKLGSIKLPAIPYLYSVDEEPERLNPGVRFCFLDIHILEGAGADNLSNYSAMQEFLSGVLSADNGPYIVVAWTKDKNIFEEFKAYLTDPDRMAECPRPIDVVCVDKFNPVEAPAVIDAVINQNPEFKALLDWERTVRQSAARTIDALYAVSYTTETEMNQIMKALGHSSIGHSNLEGNVFMGINEALMPILKDHQTHCLDASDVWDTLIDTPQDRIANATKGKIAPTLNAHLWYEYGEQIDRKMPGAIVEINHEDLKALYPEIGAEDIDLLGSMLRCEKKTSHSDFMVFIEEAIREEKVQSTFHLLELTPCCDFAQEKVLRSKYLIGIKLRGEKKKLDKFKASNDSVYITNTVSLQGDDMPSRFAFCSNYVLTIAHNSLDSYPCNYRMREQLFTVLQSHYARHVTRSGLIEL